MTKGLKIVAVTTDGLAEAVGISSGDVLLSLNGETVIDHLNYQFLVSQRDCTEVTVKKTNGYLLCVELENGGDALGLELEEDKIRVCRQNCVFCFVQQMPRGFRPGLYVKDEDIRLSFLYGHFTTLSNSDDAELDRIIRERLSPIHVSVHATDPSARVRLMCNTGEGNILHKIDRLIDGGIEMHTQAVIVPGYNDGKVWERTVTELWERRTKEAGKGGILSLSCVPVGLTSHRQNQPRLKEIDKKYAADWLEKWGREVRRHANMRDGEPWLMLADEWFTRAEFALPGRSYYSRSWNQIENGIGLIRRFMEHSRSFIRSERANAFANLRLLLLTGASFAPHLSKTIETLNLRVGSRIKVAAVPNKSFGESVTVSGLLCGRDLLNEAKKNLPGADGPIDAVVVPCASVRTITDSTGRYGYQFLDDMTLAEMQNKLGLSVILSGDNLSRLLFNIKKGRK